MPAFVRSHRRTRAAASAIAPYTAVWVNAVIAESLTAWVTNDSASTRMNCGNTAIMKT